MNGLARIRIALAMFLVAFVVIPVLWVAEQIAQEDKE